MTLTMTDFFCGAGGSSTGAIAVPGVEVKVAANHWKLAVDVHNANHQDAMHVQADISEYDPRLIPRTDIAWLSPSCTNHSIAQGKSRREIDAAPDLFGEVLPDAAAAEYVRLTTQRSNLVAKLARAETREKATT